ncbi:MAG: hypothetical protein ACRDEA_06320 [Microcystaceae cyanobacterium]
MTLLGGDVTPVLEDGSSKGCLNSSQYYAIAVVQRKRDRQIHRKRREALIQSGQGGIVARRLVHC